MVAAPNPCPELTGVCTEGEEDCVVHPTTTPFTGTMPAPGWCIRRWQKTIPSNYNATVELGYAIDHFLPRIYNFDVPLYCSNDIGFDCFGLCS